MRDWIKSSLTMFFFTNKTGFRSFPMNVLRLFPTTNLSHRPNTFLTRWELSIAEEYLKCAYRRSKPTEPLDVVSQTLHHYLHSSSDCTKTELTFWTALVDTTLKVLTIKTDFCCHHFCNTIVVKWDNLVY